MEPRLSRLIWTHTRPQQVFILLIVLISMIPYYMSFDLPKQIVNGPIQGDGFATPDATQVFLRIAPDLPFVGKVEIFSGIPLDQMGMLFALSFVFLGLVIVNGLFKFYINTYKGRLGERFLRRIRFDLVDRILRFPPENFKRLKGAEVASMVKDEVEPLGGFTGDAFVLPVMLGGQALTALVFIFIQSFWLGLLTALIVGIQVLIIPRMRRRLLVLGRMRQLTARELAGRVSEIVDGIGTIHAYDTSNYERADIASRLGRIFKIRYDIYQWKFMVKFINNFLASVTPFLFYAVGGYLALNGRLDIGQLVAVIGAYKDLPGPLKELIDWDQARQDVQVKYQQVVNQFTIDGLTDPAVQVLTPVVAADALKRPLAAVNLGLDDEGGGTVLDRVNLQFDRPALVAMTGDASGSPEALAESIARLVRPQRGRVVAGDVDLLALPEAVTGRAITYVAPEPHFFFGTLRDNLLYGLKHAPLADPATTDETERQRRWQRGEARSSGNPEYDLESDWIDYAAAGATSPQDLLPAVMRVLGAVELSDDIIELAKRSTIDPAQYPELAQAIVGMRKAIPDELAARNLRNVIAVFEPDAYNPEATVGENLLFGNPTGPALQFETIAANQHFRRVVGRNGLGQALFDMGFQIAEQAVELFAGLPPDHPFFEQLTFMSPEDIPRYEKLLPQLRGRGFADATDAERTQIIRLSFAYNELRHRFGLLTGDLQQMIVDSRRAFHADMPPELAGAIEPYDPALYIASASILDNALFGRVSNRFATEIGTVHTVINDLFRRLGLYEMIYAVGLEFHIGTAGKRLSVLQRQKLNLARAMVRRSDYYVFNRPLSVADPLTQERILRNVLDLIAAERGEAGVLWVLSNAELSRHFGRVVTFRSGGVASDGPPQGATGAARGRDSEKVPAE
jgi:putative ABC transport system ATP-binding protein